MKLSPETAFDLRISGCTQIILEALLENERVSLRRLFKLTRASPGAHEDAKFGTIYVQLYTLRQRLAWFGMTIERDNRSQYYLAPETRQRLLNWTHPTQNAA